jgi:hypothetical protein
MSTPGHLPLRRGRQSCTMSLRMAGNLSHMRTRDSRRYIRECRWDRTSHDCRHSPCTLSSLERRRSPHQEHHTSILRNSQRVRRGSARRGLRLPVSPTTSRSQPPNRQWRDSACRVWDTSQVPHQPSHRQCYLRRNGLDRVDRLSGWPFRSPSRQGLVPEQQRLWAVRRPLLADESARR